MVKNIFYGEGGATTGLEDVALDMVIVPKGDIIEMDTPDMSLSGNTKKIDILYYNSINRYGEVLRSAVYISEVKDVDDTTEIAYSPLTLLNNSSLEKSFDLQGDAEYDWLNDTITQTVYTMLNNTSFRKTNPYSRYDFEVDYAPLISGTNYMYDGWYTLVSLAPNTIPDAATVRQGMLRNRSGNIEWTSVTNPTIISNWSPIDTINTSMRMFQTDGIPHVSKDFFIMSKTNSLYNKLMNKQLSGEKFTGLRSIRAKLRTIYNNAEYGSFEIPQHMVTSMNMSLASLNL